MMKLRILALAGAALLLSACSTQEIAPPEVIEEVIEETTEEPVTQTQTDDSFTIPEDHNHQEEGVAYLLPEEAEDLALAYVGLTPKQVSKLRNRFEAKHESTIYDVKFIADGKEYDFTIDAVTGEILEFEIDGTDSAASVTDSKLSREQVTTIALEHAGFTTDQVQFLYVTFDLDDGVPEYEVEFVANAKEYEYTIHAQTGDILEFDMDD